jgi:hypothetical protein
VPARDDKRQLIAVHDDRREIGVGGPIGDDAEIGAVIADIGRNAAGQTTADRQTH